MRDALRLVGVLAWMLWNLPAICRMCAEEERDRLLKARDGGEA